MKFQIPRKFIISLSSLIILLCILLSCSNSNAGAGDTSQSPIQSNYDQKIELLESQIVLLMQNHNISKEEYLIKIEELQKEISELKKESNNSSENEENNKDDEKDDPTTDSPSTDISRFTYKSNGAEATITGYTGADEILVIPTSIDGYTITAISDGAIKSDTIKEVIISTSVTNIGWFAFSDCSRLTSVTIPANVTKIGYSAFGSANASIIIYCHSGSFAQNYAESYGITYTLI